MSEKEKDFMVVYVNVECGKDGNRGKMDDEVWRDLKCCCEGWFKWIFCFCD